MLPHPHPEGRVFGAQAEPASGHDSWLKWNSGPVTLRTGPACQYQACSRAEVCRVDRTSPLDLMVPPSVTFR